MRVRGVQVPDAPIVQWADARGNPFNEIAVGIDDCKAAAGGEVLACKLL